MIQNFKKNLILSIDLFFKSRSNGKYIASETSLVSALKSCTSLSAIHYGEQLHSFVLKLGLLETNIFIQNSLINLYAKCANIESARSLFNSCSLLDSVSWNTMLSGYVKLGQLDNACRLFDEMPERNRDCVSFTTMIMGLAQNNQWFEASELFSEMRGLGVSPNEVTLASLISAYSQLGGSQIGSMLHALVVKTGLEVFTLVSTNLVNMYLISSRLEDAKVIFNEMPERNVVTWNVMLKGYSKLGLVDLARDLFERIPERDLVSWSTMIDGYIRVDRLDEALGIYREMKRHKLQANDVLIVDLVSACGRKVALNEGRQLHCVSIKSGLNCYVFMQATLVHFYAACGKMDLACLQFHLGCKDNISSWNALIAGFVRNSRVDLARQVFDAMPERDVVSWSSMISGYAQTGKSDTNVEFFHEMLASGVQPNEFTMVSLLSSIASSGILHQGRWIHNYICNTAIPLNDNLSAALIDMYAKCGSIDSAMEVFNQVKDKTISVSPWNAVICGLAIHGHANVSLRVFSDLQKTNIRPNSITFIGVLTACCHTGLFGHGEWYFNCMKSVYNIEPNIKHYGCMVDLLGRAGSLVEAEKLIESMPMKADVVMWGTLLAASKTHDNPKIGERAAQCLTELEPTHGASKVVLSNIYASAERWDNVLQVRDDIQSQSMKKLPGVSGVI